jgi:hypothetical protein
VALVVVANYARSRNLDKAYFPLLEYHVMDAQEADDDVCAALHARACNKDCKKADVLLALGVCKDFLRVVRALQSLHVKATPAERLPRPFQHAFVHLSVSGQSAAMCAILYSATGGHTGVLVCE